MSVINEKLFDEHGIPKAYSMVKALEKVEDDINSGTDPGDSGRVPYFNIVTTIREELVGYLEPQEVDRLEELLLDKEFDKAYDFLEEH